MSTLAQQQAAYLDEYSRLQRGGQSELYRELERLNYLSSLSVGLKLISNPVLPVSVIEEVSQ